jgi:transposase-like protein
MLNISPQLLPHFKGFCSSASVIMLFVYMKCRFSLSYRDLEEMMMIRGGSVASVSEVYSFEQYSRVLDIAMPLGPQNY